MDTVPDGIFRNEKKLKRMAKNIHRISNKARVVVRCTPHCGPDEVWEDEFRELMLKAHVMLTKKEDYFRQQRYQHRILRKRAAAAMKKPAIGGANIGSSSTSRDTGHGGRCTAARGKGSTGQGSAGSRGAR